MKKYIVLFLSCIAIFVNAVEVCADGYGIFVGDSSGETLFTGSASSHYLLLSGGGVVSAWGDNTYGQCGTETCDIVTDINYIDFENKVIKVSAGNDFSLALDENNIAWGWGDNTQFQLGISEQTTADAKTQFSTPAKISEGIIDIAVGENFSVFLNETGEILFSGMGNTDALKVLELPQVTDKVPKIELIAAGYNNIVAVDENNMVYWLKTDTSFTEAAELPKNIKVEAAEVGREHFALKCSDSDNTYIYTCGDNSKSQLGTDETAYSRTPVRILTLPHDEYKYVNIFAGEYNVIADAWSNMSYKDSVTEYRWGSGCRNINGEGCSEAAAISQPETAYSYYQLIAAGADKYMAFDYVTNSIMLYGADDESVTTVPLVETDDDLQPVFKYQYENTEYQTYTVNFVKLNKETFQEGNKLYDETAGEYTDKYLLWEFVDEHHFRVKIKNFIVGVRLEQSTVMLSKEVTGENRLIGTYGPSLWSFRFANISLTTNEQKVTCGREDGTIIPITALQYRNVPGGAVTELNLGSGIPVFYEDPGTISEETRLGLYIYGLPDGVEANVTWNDDGGMEIRLSGNSDAASEDETRLKYCLIHILNRTDLAGSIGDYDLDNVLMNVSYGYISKFSICPPVCNISNLRVLSETGEEIESIPQNSDFIAEVSFNKTTEDRARNILFLSVCDIDGALLYIDSVNASFAKGFNYSFGFHVPIQTKEIGKLKAFVWSDLDSMEALGTAKELINVL